jgi:hypothetical protein
MLSLIINGDLAENLAQLNERVYIRPILLPRRTLHSNVEEIPERYIPMDLVHRSVVRLFEQGAIPNAVRVICLCVADAMRPLDAFASPWAKLVDYLSWKYGILFILSAGNHPKPFELPIPTAAFPATPAEVVEEGLLRQVVASAASRPILSPAEAINALTIGATSDDRSMAPQFVTTAYSTITHNLPAPYSAIGGGVGRMLKPEVFFPGGRQAFTLDPLSPAALSRLKPTAGRGVPGQKVASPPRSTAYLKGTSNAAALAVRAAAEILDVIEAATAGSNLSRAGEACLAKALLVHSATWGPAHGSIARLLPVGIPPTQSRNEIARILGYGFARPERVVECTSARITVIGTARIMEDRSMIYRFPLPPSLASRVATRSIVTTLAFLTPIAVSERGYRTHNVWMTDAFKGNSFDGALRMKTTDAHEPTVSRGTLQHQIFTGDAAIAFVDGDFLEFQVSCKRDAGERVMEGIPFGFAATLEVHTDLGVDLYSEVRARIAVVTRVQPQIDV